MNGTRPKMSYRLHLGDDIAIDTGPCQNDSHWKQTVRLYDPEIPVSAGDNVKLTASHDCIKIIIEPIRKG